MAQLLLNGFVTGLILALPALALSLTFSVLRFANYAIGSMIAVGAYSAYLFNVVLGWPLVPATAAGAAVLAMVAVAIDRIVYRRLRGRSGVTLLVASMGIALALENAIRFIAGNSPRGYAVEIARPFRFWGLRVNHEQPTILVTVLAALAIVWIVFRYTHLGRSMRAVADNPDLAAVRGISRTRVVTGVWLLSSAITAVAGVLIGLDAEHRSTDGLELPAAGVHGRYPRRHREPDGGRRRRPDAWRRRRTGHAGPTAPLPHHRRLPGDGAPAAGSGRPACSAPNG